MGTKKIRVKYHPTKLFTTDLNSLHQSTLKQWYTILFNGQNPPPSYKVAQLRTEIRSRRDSLVSRAGIVPEDLQKKISSTLINKLEMKHFQHYIILYNCRLLNRGELIKVVRKHGLLSDDDDTAVAAKSADEMLVRDIHTYLF